MLTWNNKINNSTIDLVISVQRLSSINICLIVLETLNGRSNVLKILFPPGAVMRVLLSNEEKRQLDENLVHVI